MIAERIKALRTARGWTQENLSHRLYMTRNGVNSWEQGFSVPSPQLLGALAREFSVSADYLLGVEGLEKLNVSDLNDGDIAILKMLADRLRRCGIDKTDYSPDDIENLDDS